MFHNTRMTTTSPRFLLSFLLVISSLLSVYGDPGHPVTDEKGNIHDYPGYALQYDEENKQADWVYYELTKEEVYGTVAARTNKFIEDPGIQSGSATAEDYRKSGYDRGHLAPAADMKFSEAAMHACFYYSNMSPQVPTFNRGVWGDLEAMVRYWAVENGAVFVITGPLFDKSKKTSIGPHHVAVPDRFFKVILDYRQPELKAIAFILCNSADPQDIAAAACSVDEAERLTGMDFFSDLPDKEESAIENSYNVSLWPLVKFSLQRFPEK